MTKNKENRNRDVNRIKRVYKGMRERCYQVNHVSYKLYGGKGIEVKCTRNEFIKWYLDNVTDDIINPHVDRIDPNGHYEFKNMQIISANENLKKAFRQNSNRPHLKKLCLENNKKQMKKIKIDGIIYESIREASRKTGISRDHIRNVLNKCSKMRSKKTRNIELV